MAGRFAAAAFLLPVQIPTADFSEYFMNPVVFLLVCAYNFIEP